MVKTYKKFLIEIWNLQFLRDKNSFKTVNKTTVVKKKCKELTLPAQTGTSNSYYCLLSGSRLTWEGSHLLYHLEEAVKLNDQSVFVNASCICTSSPCFQPLSLPL